LTGLDTLMTISQQVMLLPDQYLRQGITILQGAIHLARLEEEARREQALLVREALEESGVLVAPPTAMTAEGQTLPQANQKWGEDFRAGDPDRQHIAASEASTLTAALEGIIDKLQYTNVTERLLVAEVREAINRVRAIGNHEPTGEESAAPG
jgi:hypothetical protein